ncbi:ketoacyl-ACP synthase III family protein [Streptomyces sp. PBH53]|uniref:ketoacyl-ACP synthase III family protein n=1 Tax=Streptomyces sp. PBH53 TaxID=1577075 RepID=UPI000A6926A0|nr:ketoacyl-ACP synthase III family protein [Streptomyces sp. PBH53]
MKLPAPLGLAGHTWYPPDRDLTADAVREGRVDAKTARELGYEGLLLSADTAPPDMAVHAARPLLERIGCPADALGTLFHASIHYQGHDIWSAPHYIARELGTGAQPVGLLQQCNGGATGIELAATALLADPECGPGLVTTADRFQPPVWDRWLGDFGMAVGDAATAVVVHRGEYPADLLLHATGTVSVPELEEMHRGNDAFNTAPLEHSPVIDVRRTKRAFIRRHGIDRFYKAAHQGVRRAVAESLAHAGLEPDDPRLRWAVLPRLGKKAMEEAYIPPLVQVTPAELLDLGTPTGHLGAGDLNASLTQLAREERLAPGEFALILNSGGGFTFSSFIVGRP